MAYSYTDEYRRWRDNKNLEETLRKDIDSIEGNDDEIKKRFAAPLSFGTAGLRGIMQSGICGMNIYTVAQATEGVARLVKKNNGEKKGVVIACDTRNNSELFSRVSAGVLAANGIKTYIFDAPRPTPELSFALRELGAIAGINVTASHNPKAYNGYKVYWDDGAQLSPDDAAVVAAEIAKTDIFSVVVADFDKAVADGIIEIMGRNIDEKFMERVLAERIDVDAIPKVADKFGVVYTPLHGTGAALVPETLEKAGIKHLYCVPEQMKPDGNFPTVRTPNPENKDCFDLGIALAKEHGCDLVIGTDPDADRTGIVVKNKSGEFVRLTGNQVGVLLCDYIITGRRNCGKLPANACVIKSIVSTELARKVCEKNGVTMTDVLTGFKFIGEKIKEFEANGNRDHTFIFGFEESYGYLAGTYARDKDAVGASLMITEMAAHYAERGMTLYDAMEEVYEKYGFFAEKVVSIEMPGLDGNEKTAALMASLRNDSPKALGGTAVVSVADYKSGRITSADGSVSDTGLPTSDVLYFRLADGSSVVIRPSGTEPKVKVYYMVSGREKNETNGRLAAYMKAFEEIVG